MRPRPTRWLAALAAAAFVCSMAVSMPEASATPPLMFGAAVKAHAKLGPIGSVQNLEKKIGRKLRLIRVYDVWNAPFPDSYTSWLTDPTSTQTGPGTPGGRTLVLSIKAVRSDGTRIPWSSIGSASPGSTLYAQIVGWANAIEAFGQPLYLSFNHEPEAATNNPNGTATDYIAAWRNIHAIFDAQGVSNVTWTWIGTAFGFTAKANLKATRYYPGDDVVDVIGADGYNWYTCRPEAQLAWKTAAQIFGGFRTWVSTNHPTKPVIVTEFGSVEDPADATRKAGWITDAAAWFKGWNQVSGAMYWSSHAATKYPNCVFYADTSANSTTAFAQMGADPDYSA